MATRKKPRPEIVGVCIMLLAVVTALLGHPFMSAGFLIGGIIAGVLGIMLENA